VEQERRQHLAQMPLDVIGEHAQEDMRAHAVGGPMANGADFQIDGFHRAEGLFHSGEILVCLHRMRGTEVLSRHTGANDIDAIELGLGRDLIDLAGPSEVAIADVEGEVLGHLLRIHDFTNGQADLDGRAQVGAFATDLSLKRKFPFGRDQKRLALARAFSRQIAVCGTRSAARPESRES